MEELASVLGCRIEKLPTSYWEALLNLPGWDAVEERFRKRLVVWKIQYLSKGRRLTLIKITL